MSPRFLFKAVVSGMDCIRDAWSFLNISYGNHKNIHMYVYTYTRNFCFTRFCLFFYHIQLSSRSNYFDVFTDTVRYKFCL